MAQTVAVEARNVVKAFGSGPSAMRALDHVSVSINEGEFFTLLGPSGCGKTTLLKFGVIGAPISSIGSDTAVVIGMTYGKGGRPFPGNLHRQVAGLHHRDLDRVAEVIAPRVFTRGAGSGGFHTPRTPCGVFEPK